MSAQHTFGRVTFREDGDANHEAAAAAWRAAAADPFITDYMRQLCLAAARDQDRQAAGEPGRCLCCGKTPEQHQQRLFPWIR
jgi:hypothetical protein